MEEDDGPCQAAVIAVPTEADNPAVVNTIVPVLVMVVVLLALIGAALVAAAVLRRRKRRYTTYVVCIALPCKVVYCYIYWYITLYQLLSLHPRRRSKGNPEHPPSGTSAHLVLDHASFTDIGNIIAEHCFFL